MFDDIAMIWFDLDQTLCDHVSAARQAHRDLRAADPAWEAIPEERWLAEYARVNDALWAKLRQETRPWDEIRVVRFRTFTRNLALATDRAEWMAEHYIEQYIARTTLIPGARETVRRLREQGWPVGVITDGSSWVQRRKLEVSGLGALLHPMITPDEAGAFKPEPRIFQFAAESVGMPSTSHLYAGDSWETDILGARNAGWSAIWVNAEISGELVRLDDRTVRVGAIADVPGVLPTTPSKR